VELRFRVQCVLAWAQRLAGWLRQRAVRCLYRYAARGRVVRRLRHRYNYYEYVYGYHDYGYDYGYK
jgi:hypothetical protein